MRASATRLRCYRDCPRRYRYQYVDRLKGEFAVRTPETCLGESVHDALCAFFRDPAPAQRTPAQLHQLLRAHWRREGYRDLEEERRYGLRALDMLDRYFYRHDMTAVPLLLEHRFTVPLGEHELTGFFDRVDRHADGSYHLIDYKTGKHALDEREASDDLQLTVYALAFRALYGQPCATLALHYLALGRDVVSTRTPAQLDAAAADIGALIDTIITDRDYAPRPGPFCTACPYAVLCPASGETTPNEAARLDAANRRLYLLLTAGNDLAQSDLRPDLVLERGLQVLGELAGSDDAAVVWCSDDKQTVQEGRLTGAPAADAAAFYGRSEVGECLAREEAVRHNRAPGEADGRANEVFLPLRTRRRCRGFLYVARPADRPFTQNDLNFLNALALQVALALENAVIYRNAICDRLTGAFNRAYFDNAWAETLAGDEPCGLMVFDIDNFKKFNDTYGHLVGDLVLQATARAAQGAVRGTDIVCRYGGEEFAVIMPHTPPDEALTVAQRVGAAIAANRVMSGTQELSVTVSGGVACKPRDGSDGDALFAFADRGLYRAKREGKNRVAIAES